MRQGYESKLVFSKSGNLVAIATGSDYCAEHEGGSKILQSSLTVHTDVSEQTIAALRKKQQVVYPDILASKRIVKYPGELQFVKTDGDMPEAVLGFARHELKHYASELRFREGLKSEDPNVAGAWDDRSFAIRVRGKKYVKALEAFHKAMLESKVAFAGTFFKREGQELGGVVLADLSKISDDDKKAVKAAQAKMESDLRLKAASEETALYEEARKHLGNNQYIGFLWPVWSDAQETEIHYCLNPGYGVKADYPGPYTKQQLLDWVRAKCSYQLKRLSKAA